VVDTSGNLTLYARMVGARARSQMQNRLGFALDVMGTLGLGALDLLVVFVVFGTVDTLGGWTAGQVLLLYGVAQSAFAIADAIFGHLDLLPRMIRSGDFDTVLLRPRNALLMTIASDFSVRRIGQLAQALIALAAGWRTTHLAVTPLSVLTVVVAIAAGTAVFGAIWVAGAATTFWTIDTMEITNAFTYGGRQTTSYPVTIYAAWLRRLVTFVVPLATVAYFAVRHLLGLEPAGTPWVLRWAGVPAAAAGWVVALTVWRLAVRSYRGTGS